MDTHLEQFRRFAQYNQCFNQRLYALIATLSEAERQQDRGAFFGSLHGTLNHILLADRIWLGRCQRLVGPFAALVEARLLDTVASLDAILYANYAELTTERQATDAALQAWTVELTAASLSRSMRYSNSAGVVREHPLWLAIAHLFNHQTHHRGQVTTLLMQLGRDPGVTDFLVYAQQTENLP
ncbi:MAG: hypothetical protein HC910_02225 [Spirulinaceae cyanobacterium SM2_1_0]|nr:hypothetical protein [Spirulinaceae cyanobacterium SM2_1_0]